MQGKKKLFDVIHKEATEMAAFGLVGIVGRPNSCLVKRAAKKASIWPYVVKFFKVLEGTPHLWVMA